MGLRAVVIDTSPSWEKPYAGHQILDRIRARVCDNARVEDVANAPTFQDLITDRLISEAEYRRLVHILAEISGAWRLAWGAIREAKPGEDRPGLAKQMGRILDAAEEASRIADGIRPMDPGLHDPVTLGDIALTREAAGKVLRNWLQRDAHAAPAGQWTLADLEWLGGAIRILQAQQAMIRAYRAGSNGGAA
jgi:hypothetical protein